MPPRPSTPSHVTVDDVRHVATLARLGLTEDRLHALTKDLNTILDHMEVLSRVDTKGVDELATSLHIDKMRLRADHGSPIPLDEPPEAFAPQMRDGFFVVPRLATHEDVE